MALQDEIRKRYGNVLQDYDAKQNIPFTIVPQQAGAPTNTIDVNTIPEEAVDELIRQFGGQGQLIGRKNYLTAGRELQEGQQKEQAQVKEQSLKDEIAKALGANIDNVYNRAADFAGGAIERNFAPVRQKALSEEAALGRLSSPVSAYTTNRLNEMQSNSLQNIIGSLAGQRAGGEVDLAKYLQTVLAGERRAGEQSDQFMKNYELGKNQFQSSLENAAANRTLQERIAAMSGRGDSGGDAIGGALSGGLSGAAAGSAAGPWGALIGGVGGAALGGYAGSRKKTS